MAQSQHPLHLLLTGLSVPQRLTRPRKNQDLTPKRNA
jgi:hypothetical protein